MAHILCWIGLETVLLNDTFVEFTKEKWICVAHVTITTSNLTLRQNYQSSVSSFEEHRFINWHFSLENYIPSTNQYWSCLNGMIIQDISEDKSFIKNVQWKDNDKDFNLLYRESQIGWFCRICQLITFIVNVPTVCLISALKISKYIEETFIWKDFFRLNFFSYEKNCYKHTKFLH